MEHFIIIVAFVFIYYHIGGLGTTNILRLTAGNTLSVNSSKCMCDNCGSQIPPILQFPIFSYIICRGRCKKCGISIPTYPLKLECVIIIGMNLITALFDFAPMGVILSFGFYEFVRVVVVRIRGRRESKFKQQYFVAVLSMIPFFLATLFVSCLYQTI